MVFLLFMLFLFSGQLCAGDKPTTIYIQLPIGFNDYSLHYVSKELVDSCKRMGIVCEYNTPFLPLDSSIGEGTPFYDSLPSAIKNLKSLPYTVFVRPENNDSWKTKESKLCTLELENKKYQLKLNSRLSDADYSITSLIEGFRKNANHNFDIEKWLVNDGNKANEVKVQNYLLNTQILEYLPGSTKTTHGPQGFFAKEYAVRKTAAEKQAYWNGVKSVMINVLQVSIVLMILQGLFGHRMDSFFQSLVGLK